MSARYFLSGSDEEVSLHSSLFQIASLAVLWQPWPRVPLLAPHWLGTPENATNHLVVKTGCTNGYIHDVCN